MVQPTPLRAYPRGGAPTEHPHHPLAEALPITPVVDYYEVLQVHPAAEPEVVSAAYRRLAQKYHPDVNAGSPAAAKRMAQINEAWDVLRDPSRRATYDRTRVIDPTWGQKPVLVIRPARVVVQDLNPDDSHVTFAVEVDQAGGPPFDPRIHKLDVRLRPPWNSRQVRSIRKSTDSLPTRLEFTMDVGDVAVEPNTTYEGDVEIVVKVEL